MNLLLEINVGFALVFVAMVVKFSRSTLLKIVCGLNFLIFVNPLLIFWITDVSHPKFTFEESLVSRGLFYFNCYIALVVLGFEIFYKFLRKIKSHRSFGLSWLELSISNKKIFFSGVLCCFLIGLLSKLLLNDIGAFKKLDVRPTEFAYLQPLKAFASFDILALVALGAYRRTYHEFLPLIVSLALVVCSVIAIGFAIWSGSRGQVIIIVVLALIGFGKDLRKRPVMTSISIVCLGVIIPWVFPFIAALRGNANDVFAALRYLSSVDSSLVNITLDIFATRLNYLVSLISVFYFVDIFETLGGQIYGNNLVGLIPKAIWAEKPNITNDGNFLGHILGMLNTNDHLTSIGLRDIGESFLHLGWFGLSVGVVQSALYALTEWMFGNKRQIISQVVYVSFILYVCQLDAWFAAIPGMAYVAVSLILFFGVILIFTGLVNFFSSFFDSESKGL